MRSVLILAAANIATCPRAMRMVEILKDGYEVSVMGIDNDDGSKMPQVFVKDANHNAIAIPSFSYPAYKKRNFYEEIKLYGNVALKRWDKLSFTHNRLKIIEHLAKYHYDVVICHDLLLLPVLFAGLEQGAKMFLMRKPQTQDSQTSRVNVSSEVNNKLSQHNINKQKATKVIFDAREFYPLQNTSSLRWRVLFKRFNTYLVKTYAKKADVILTVSPKFIEMYQAHFHLNPTLLMSLPPYYALKPQMCDNKHIKILYHGALNANRGIDKLIKLCAMLDKRFYIDFIFTGGTQKFRKKIESHIKALQSQGANVRILPPVSLEQIIPFGNSYDIGLLYIPPHNHNLLATLPNKFFEYIQSNLALALPPLPQIMPFILRYSNAFVAEDFSIKALAEVLKNVSVDEIMRKKWASHTAAQELNLSQNTQKVRDIIKRLLA